MAAQQGNKELVDELLREEVGDLEGVALHTVKGGHKGLVFWLIERGADIETSLNT